MARKPIGSSGLALLRPAAFAELDHWRESGDRLSVLMYGPSIQHHPGMTDDRPVDRTDSHQQRRVSAGAGKKPVRKQASLETVRAPSRPEARQAGARCHDGPLPRLRARGAARRPHEAGKPRHRQHSLQQGEHQRPAGHLEQLEGVQPSEQRSLRAGQGRRGGQSPAGRALPRSRQSRSADGK